MRRRKTLNEVSDVSEEEEEDESLNPSKNHSTRTKRPHNVADPAMGQQSLINMWGQQTTTSQETNKVQNGEEQ